MRREILLDLPRARDHGEAVRRTIFLSCDRQVRRMGGRQWLQPDQGTVQDRNVGQEAHD
jgi:hypothetical protein